MGEARVTVTVLNALCSCSQLSATWQNRYRQGYVAANSVFVTTRIKMSLKDENGTKTRPWSNRICSLHRQQSVLATWPS